MIVECNEIVLRCDNITRLTVVDTDREPISLTGERIVFALAENLQDEPVIVKDSDNGPTEIEILAAPNDNQALIKITPADLAVVNPGCYCRSIQVFFSAKGICAIPVNDVVNVVASTIINITSP